MLVTEQFQKYYDEMSEMQHKLNIKIGIDTKNLNEYEKLIWFYNYLQALSDEIVEAKNCISWKWWSKESKENGQFSTILDFKNLKIELVDMLHFILSLDHVTNYKLNIENTIVLNSQPPSGTNYWETFKLLDQFLFKVQSIKNDKYYFELYSFPALIAANDKYINKDFFNLNGIKDNYVIGRKLQYTVYMDEIWNQFVKCYLSLDITFDTLFNIYLLKNEVNFERQNNDYSVLTKTEEDNNKIKEQI